MKKLEELRFKVLEKPEEMEGVEALQLAVWPGSERDVVPAHLLLTVAKNGGLVIGAMDGERVVGFVFGFLGVHRGVKGKDGVKHCSHMMGVHPNYRNRGLGFRLKRAQWQMVRKQGIELITWTYDPLLSRNANLNIAKLGAVGDVYRREVYGQMRDGLNVGLPSDRFEVQWWVNSKRVNQRLSSKPRRRLDLAHFLGAGAEVLNPTQLDEAGWPAPPEEIESKALRGKKDKLLLVEIPSDFQGIKKADMQLALKWRLHSRELFEKLFEESYMVTDFVYLPGKHPRSYYVLSHGGSTLGE